MTKAMQTAEKANPLASTRSPSVRRHVKIAAPPIDGAAPPIGSAVAVPVPVDDEPEPQPEDRGGAVVPLHGNDETPPTGAPEAGLPAPEQPPAPQAAGKKDPAGGAIPWKTTKLPRASGRVQAFQMDRLLSGPTESEEPVPIPKEIADAVAAARKKARRITRTKVTGTTVRAHALAYGLTRYADWAGTAPSDGRRDGGYAVYGTGSVVKVSVTGALWDALDDVVDREQQTRGDQAPSRQSVILTAMTHGLANVDEWLAGVASAPVHVLARVPASAD